MTGIDRVELAYLNALPERFACFYGFVRVGRSYFLLDRNGTIELRARLHGETPWGSRDLKARLFRRHGVLRQSALSDLRRLSMMDCRPDGLRRALENRCGPGLRYLNVGHSNIDSRVFAAVSAVATSRTLVLLHDVIPLEFPQYQRTGSVQEFEEKLKVIAALADLVIHPSADSRFLAEKHFARIGPVPNGVVAHLGVEVAEPVHEDLPVPLRSLGQFFLTIGTIEPRKNHRLLLDLWRVFEDEPDAPTLVIAGQRGWNNEEVFRRLDEKPRHVIEVNDLTDAAMSALLRNADALLHPSYAEGFGLPPAEAALIGTKVVCSDLAVFREVLGNSPVYLNESDLYSWERTIRNLATGNANEARANGRIGAASALPTWQDHFNTVLNLL